MNKNKSYPRSRGKKPKGISKGLRDRIEENTRINNDKIKFYDTIETRDTYLVQNLLKETKV